VDIVAFATADHTKNVVAAVSVTCFLGNLSGKYVFQAAGGRIDPITQTEKPYRITGVVNLDGNGGVGLVNLNGRMAGGEQTIVGSTGSGSAKITGGSYTLGPDGRGLLTVNTDDTTIGVKGVETFSIVFLSSSQILIAQADGSASASGAMDLQTSTSVPAGGYAFAVTGGGVAFGGVLNVDQANGAISGNGSVADQAQSGGTLHSCHGPGGSGGSGISGAFAAADAFGAVQLNLSTCFSASPLQFIGYLVDNKHIKLIETDFNSKTSAGFATTGIALGQGSATGTFTGSQSFAGTYVFGIEGSDSSGLTSSLTSAGTVASTGTGTLSGNADELTSGDELITTPIMISDGFRGIYTVDSSSIGRIDVPVTFNQTNNTALSTPELIFYLSGNGGPALVLDSDPTASALGVGIAFPQAASPSFSGNYGLNWSNLSQSTASGFSTSDTTGNMKVDSVTNMLSGLVDEGPSSLGQNALSLTGIIHALSAAGSFSGSMTAVGSGFGSNTVMVDYYLADSNHGFVIETDFQNSLLLGYFAARIPVCPTCP
jgi:hypothetical protein